MSAQSAATLIEHAREGQVAAVGRLISVVEQGGPPARAVAGAVRAQPAGAYTIGITGAPGAGKSTLTSRLVGALRALGDRVAVLAIDPSSPHSGGAILGDRVRMHEHASDAGVFIRSMATRGHLGGLALAAPEAVRVLSAAGYAHVLLETVGVGQAELEVSAAADTTVVVVNPGWGDDVQAAKAGLLEIADVFAVNKADRPGADLAAAELEHMLDAGAAAEGWRPPVVETVATLASGADALLAAVASHRAWLGQEGRLARRRADRLWHEVEAIVTARARERIERALADGAGRMRADVARGALDPWSAGDAILEGLG